MNETMHENETTDETTEIDDHEVYALMVRLRLQAVLAAPGKAYRHTYRSEKVGLYAWEQLLDEATRVLMRDVVLPLCEKDPHE